MARRAMTDGGSTADHACYRWIQRTRINNVGTNAKGYYICGVVSVKVKALASILEPWEQPWLNMTKFI
ncbi:hypothetical protein WN944_028138 [Citrus x changshan-huyou]|uniref:Uncharacterized protein n=1 Tax=Citrus x changshan-huyou TaxID=2935761 RepID=A0AAP0LM58_9ROSI